MHTKPLSSATSIQTKDGRKKETKGDSDNVNSFPSHLACQIKSGSLLPCLKYVKNTAGCRQK